jgi:hypothetical protein
LAHQRAKARENSKTQKINHPAHYAKLNWTKVSVLNLTKKRGHTLKTLHIAAFALNAALYVATGILFYTILPVSFGPVRFWPQALIPAVFAAVFGPWVGGAGAALGIFVNDLMLNNNPILSLLAGVTANFACFWLIGYLAQKRFHWITSVVGYGAFTALLLAVAYLYTDFVYVIIVGVSYVIFTFLALMIRKWFHSRWQSYEIASVIGLLIGSAIIGLMVPIYFQFFAPDAIPITLGSGLAYFIWTFTTEIPFLLILGPPLIGAIYLAFPNLKSQEALRNKNSEKNS